jgi:hypothetical protein
LFCVFSMFCCKNIMLLNAFFSCEFEENYTVQKDPTSI